MPEIGPTLREARMRARIDITEIEEATKIRAKYLRAIENEEWGLLPAPAFVKSFVREYADYLGLDSRLLVEEYKLRHEGPSEHELQPISPNLGRERRGGGGGGGIGRPPVPPRWAIVGALVIALIVALGVLGSLGGSDGGNGNAGGSSDRTGTTRGSPTTTTSHRRTPVTQAPAPTEASVRLIPTGTIYVCLVDQDGKVLIPGSTFTAGQRVPVYRARTLRLTLGNNAVTLRVNGRSVPVAPSANAISFELTPTAVRPLPAAKAPTCT